MTIVDFNALTALIGGALIGLSAVIMMITIGKITGISGIFSTTLKSFSGSLWQWAFIGGLFSSGLMLHWLFGPVTIEIQTNKLWLVIAGLLVGVGTRLGGGCTSGHGVCGIARFSPRSMVATPVFIAAGVLTVVLMNLVV